VENLAITEQEARLSQTLIESQVDGELGFEGTSIIFNEDGRFTAREDGVEVQSGTYSLQNNNSVLVLTSDDGVQEFEVQELTNNKMVIAFEGEEQEDLTGDDQPEDIGFNLDVTFLK
ncbi:MAG TPA: lipocalin family protein, partial [Cyclobacteriaceae bacterium]|nr:lipocalin family protein [Cyclobacteriaceae bacterium]